MGFLSKAVDSMTGGASKAAKKAAKAQAEMARLAEKENRRQYDITRKNLLPFYNTGIGHLRDVTRGASARGFGNSLAELLGGESISPIVGARYDALQDSAGAAGLNFNPQQAQEMARLNPEEALQMEGMLYGRQAGMAGQAQNMAGQLGGLGIQHGQDIASLLNQGAQARSGGELGQAQAFNQGINSIIGLGSAAAGAFGK